MFLRSFNSYFSRFCSNIISEMSLCSIFILVKWYSGCHIIWYSTMAFYATSSKGAYCFLVLGHTQRCSRLCVQGSLLGYAQGGHIWHCRWNWGQLYARQVPQPWYSLSVPRFPVFFFFLLLLPPFLFSFFFILVFFGPQLAMLNDYAWGPLRCARDQTWVGHTKPIVWVAQFEDLRLLIQSLSLQCQELPKTPLAVLKGL